MKITCSLSVSDFMPKGKLFNFLGFTVKIIWKAIKLIEKLKHNSHKKVALSIEKHEK